MTLVATPVWALVSGVCLLLLAALFTVRTLKADLRTWPKVLLLACHWVAALSLWLALCQPHRPVPPQNEVMLVTPGGTANRVSGRVVSLSGFDLHPLHQQAPNATQLTVLGHGLPLTQWRGTTAQLTLRPPPLPRGLIDVRWPQRLVYGETLVLSARVNDMPEVSQAVLLAPGGDVISQTLLRPDREFDLDVNPPSPGPLTLTLALRDRAGQTLIEEPLPVWVETPKGPRVLMLLGRLSFEARDLQRWLADTTPGLQLSASVGKQVRRTIEVADAPPENLWQTDPQSLNLVVADTAWLSQRSSIETDQLARAISGGMGLLILADESALKIADGPLLDVFQLRSAQPVTHDLLLDGQPISVARVGLTAAAGEPALVSTGPAQALALTRQLGGGRVVLSLMDNSYALNTQGRGNEYASLWQSLVSAAARPLAATRWLAAPLPIMMKGESIDLCEPQRCTQRKLTSDGWNNLDGEFYYAFSDQHWTAYRAQELQRQTALAVQLRNGAQMPLQRYSHWPPTWLLWVLFLLASGWIWLQQKFH
ncbi:MAG: hypothetical protein AB8B96_03685 [Lysobacterales bacterium]